MMMKEPIDLGNDAAFRICGCCAGLCECLKYDSPFLTCSTWHNSVKELALRQRREYRYNGKPIYVEGITETGI